MSTSFTDSIGTKNDVVLRWQVHLAKEQPRKLMVVIAAIIAMTALSCVWFRSPIAVIVTVLVLVGALSDFLLPMTFVITTKHVSAYTLAGKRMMAWEDVRKCYIDESGVKISPLPKASRLEAYRGVYLRFGDNREEVIAAVTRLKPKDG
ncbi:MAG: hypothetical protein ABFD64_03390 [Armatimonadota bacterium]